MSSFRPDSDSGPPGFVARTLEGLGGFCAVANLEMPRGGSDPFAEPDGEGGRDLALDTLPKATESPLQYTSEDLEAAEQAGFERGVASVDSARQELERVASVLDASAADLRADIETRWREWIAGEREAVIEIASAIAEQWVRGSIEADATLLTTMLDTALRDVADSNPERLFLSAADLDRLKRERSEGNLRWEPAPELELESDLRLEPGEFRIALQHGWIDGRFEQIRRSLREHWTELAARLPALASPDEAEGEA